MDALETQLLLHRAQVKSPGFAAVLGFFFPWAAAFYNGKIVAGIVFLIIDCIFWVLSIFGIGVVFLVFYGLIAAYQNYVWAKQANERELERLILLQKQVNAAGA